MWTSSNDHAQTHGHTHKAKANQRTFVDNTQKSVTEQNKQGKEDYILSTLHDYTC